MLFKHLSLVRWDPWIFLNCFFSLLKYLFLLPTVFLIRIRKFFNCSLDIVVILYSRLIYFFIFHNRIHQVFFTEGLFDYLMLLSLYEILLCFRFALREGKLFVWLSFWTVERTIYLIEMVCISFHLFYFLISDYGSSITSDTELCIACKCSGALPLVILRLRRAN